MCNHTRWANTCTCYITCHFSRPVRFIFWVITQPHLICLYNNPSSLSPITLIRFSCRSFFYLADPLYMLGQFDDLSLVCSPLVNRKESRDRRRTSERRDEKYLEAPHGSSLSFSSLLHLLPLSQTGAFAIWIGEKTRCDMCLPTDSCG